jgi:hypothetical protein
VAFDAVLASLNAQPDSAVATIEKLQRRQALTREVSELKVKAAMGGGTAPMTVSSSA